MKKLFFLLFLVYLLPSYSRTLIIGTTRVNPPFESVAGIDSNHNKERLFGLDIDLMLEICRRIHQNCEFSLTQFDDLFTGLKGGKIDMAIAGIIITAERQKEFLFSLPYLVSNAQFMTISSSTITGPDQLKQKKIGVRVNTPCGDLATQIYRNNITLIGFPQTPSLLDALNQKAVDAVFMDSEVVKAWVTNNDTSYKSIGTPIPIGYGYGIMAPKNQNELISQMNEALLEMESDGTYLKIYRKYFLD